MALQSCLRNASGTRKILFGVPRVDVRRHYSSVREASACITPLSSILIANRGEIALRIGRTASQHGIRCTTIYTDPDAQAQHALSSPYAVNLGDPVAYLDGDRIIDVARKERCGGIHPGYGFLSENATFAKKCTEAGVIFIGPPWEAIEAMGDKSQSKNIMTAAGVPCIPGYHGRNQAPEFLKSEAEKIGFPVLLKAVKGGGGKGMRIVTDPGSFSSQLESAKSEARNSFGNDAMLVEKYITTPRHIEVQIFADKYGNCVALGERDCSIQRRHQKIIEESPAPHLDEEVRQDLWRKARAAALAVGYEGAGTVEFIFDYETSQFFFMEMNTRLQVEHPVTEMITGQDLVRWQIVVAEGGQLPLHQDEIQARIAGLGHAIEARIYAENPDLNFTPDSGRLIHLRTPTETENVRIDAGFIAGDELSSFYDPMISKLIVRGPTRASAIQRLRAALEQYEIVGPVTNIEFLKRICTNEAFVAGHLETSFIERHHDTLFHKLQTADEVFAQAALGLLLQETAERSKDSFFGSPGAIVGFGPGYQEREFSFVNEGASAGRDAPATRVVVRQIGPSSFDISVNATRYAGVEGRLDPISRSLTSFYPHTRLDTTIVTADGDMTIFQRGRQYKIRCSTPTWLDRALGVKEGTTSVVAPMPCKILRVEVEEGAAVKKDQALVVIESMKMETVIRSPHDGVISKIVHRTGDLCKAGTALVEFQDLDVQ